RLLPEAQRGPKPAATTRDVSWVFLSRGIQAYSEFARPRCCGSQRRTLCKQRTLSSRLCRSVLLAREPLGTDALQPRTEVGVMDFGSTLFVSRTRRGGASGLETNRRKIHAIQRLRKKDSSPDPSIHKRPMRSEYARAPSRRTLVERNRHFPEEPDFSPRF